VKHLNPRQGITTSMSPYRHTYWLDRWCETPKSPPGDYNLHDEFKGQFAAGGSVKHLNPRQGITTYVCGSPRCLASRGV